LKYVLIPKNVKFYSILFYSNSDLKVSKIKSKIQLLLESNNQFYCSRKAKCVRLCDCKKFGQNCNENCLCNWLEGKNKPYNFKINTFEFHSYKLLFIEKIKFKEINDQNSKWDLQSSNDVFAHFLISLDFL
jgi:hypothetical protein